MYVHTSKWNVHKRFISRLTLPYWIHYNHHHHRKPTGILKISWCFKKIKLSLFQLSCLWPRSLKVVYLFSDFIEIYVWNVRRKSRTIHTPIDPLLLMSRNMSYIVNGRTNEYAMNDKQIPRVSKQHRVRLISIFHHISKHTRAYRIYDKYVIAQQQQQQGLPATFIVFNITYSRILLLFLYNNTAHICISKL